MSKLIESTIHELEIKLTHCSDDFNCNKHLRKELMKIEGNSNKWNELMQHGHPDIIKRLPGQQTKLIFVLVLSLLKTALPYH